MTYVTYTNTWESTAGGAGFGEIEGSGQSSTAHSFFGNCRLGVLWYGGMHFCGRPASLNFPEILASFSRDRMLTAGRY